MEIGRIVSLDGLAAVERRAYADGNLELARVMRTACELVEEANDEANDLQVLVDNNVLTASDDMALAYDKLDELIRLLDTDDTPDLALALKLAAEARRALDV